MNKLFLLIFMSFGILAHAEEKKDEAPCGSLKESLEQLNTHFNEKPMWMGKGDNGQMYGLIANPDGKTWSLIVFNKDTACLLMSGTGSELLQKARKGTNIRVITRND